MFIFYPFCMKRLCFGGRHRHRQPQSSIRMLVLIWASLLFSVRGSNADTNAPGKTITCAVNGFCMTLNEGVITAEAGLCAVIPCLFTPGYGFTPKHIVWYKCDAQKQRCSDSDMIFHTNKNNPKVQSGFRGRVSLLEPDVNQKNCSIIINDLTESDSGSYQLRVHGFQDGFTFTPRATISVKDLIQKPTLMISPLIIGQQTTLTCTAPGLCSGSVPKITWTWRGEGERDSHITGNVTAVKNESVTSVAQRYISTLTFDLLAEHLGTNVTCKVSFRNNITAEETVTLNVNCPVQHCSAVLPWVVAAVSLIVNVICIICMMLLWNSRKKVKPQREDRTYMSLKRTDLSSEYDVIGQSAECRREGASSN